MQSQYFTNVGNTSENTMQHLVVTKKYFTRFYTKNPLQITSLFVNLFN